MSVSDHNQEQMEDESVEIPPQPAGERAKLGLMWAVLASLAAVAIVADSPYPLDQQSTILVKSEVVINVKSDRSNVGGHWPENERDQPFAHGPLALRENPPPRFSYRETERDEHDANVEIAHYDFIVRNQKDRVKIRYNPQERPKKRFFSF